MTDDPTCVSLFSGIGGLDLGLHRAGWRHVLFCESDPYRRNVLRARFPGVPVHEDVRDICGTVQPGDSGGRIPYATDRVGDRRSDAAAGLLCGGFPCQDVSVAGRRKGLAGERSGLFHEYARIADALRPRWLLVENVPGLLSSNGGRDFGVVLGTLADLGYGVAWRILDSRFFGVPQRRRRVFIVGAESVGDPRAAAERAGQVLAVGTRCPGHPATRGEAREDAAVASLSGLGTGGPDDNDGQGGRLIAATLKGNRGKAGGCTVDVEQTYIAAPLSHGSNPNSNAAGRRREDDENLVIAGPLGGGNDGTGRRTEDDPNLVAYSLRRDPGGTGQGHNTNYVTAFSWQQGDDSKWTGTGRGRSWVARAGDYAAGLSASGRHDAVQKGATVRRLMPVECERLQALPDHWTDLGGTPDSRRYAALGDAVTASVAEWIGRRLIQQDALLERMPPTSHAGEA